MSELFIFARFRARQGLEEAVAQTLREEIGHTREEPGCLTIEAYRSTRDRRLFYIHSRWIDEAAFEAHARLDHNVRFVSRVATLIDHTLDVTRARPLEEPA
jgi:quinol monooxygenase YgiN